MKAEITISLVKELDKIRSIRSRNSYWGAWSGFFVAIVWLASLFMFSLEKKSEPGLEWFPALMFVIALIILLQSFYIIIRHIFNKKFAVILEALLEKNKID